MHQRQQFMATQGGGMHPEGGNLPHPDMLEDHNISETDPQNISAEEQKYADHHKFAEEQKFAGGPQ